MFKWQKIEGTPAPKDALLSGNPLYVVGKREFLRWNDGEFEPLPRKQVLAAEREPDGRLLAYCGDKTVCSFDPVERAWIRVLSAKDGPGHLQGPLLTRRGDEIMVYGGEHKMRCNNQTWIVSVTSGKWKKVSSRQKPPKRQFPSWTGVPDSAAILMWGGLTQNFDPILDCWRWEDGQWSQLTDRFAEPTRIFGDQELHLFAFRGGSLCYWDGDSWIAHAQLPLLEGCETLHPADLAFDSASRSLFYRDAGSMWRLHIEELLQQLPVSVLSFPLRVSSSVADAIEPASDHIALEYDEDGLIKFWTGTVSDTGLVLRWGRLGTPGQRKHIEITGDSARRELQKRAQQKRNKGYETAKVRRVEMAALLKTRGTKAIDHYFGGDSVRGLEGPWPTCAQCDVPMSLFLLAASDPEVLPLGCDGLAVFLCEGNASEGACETWLPDAGCNHVALLTFSDVSITMPQHEHAVRRPLRGIAKKLQEETEGAANISTGTKLGGIAHFVQEEVPPSCAECGEAMVYRLQLGTPYTFGDSGLAYVFVCRHEHRAAVIWQGH